MLFQNPLAQERLPLVERQIPVLCLPQNRLISRNGRFGINQVGCIQRCAASLALVAIGMFVATVRTSPGNIPVCEELVSLLVVILHRGFLDKFTFIVQLPKEIGSHFTMNLGSRARVNIERDSELLERLFNNIMITVHDILRGHSFGLRLNRDRHAMLVATADHDHIFAFQPQIPGINICRDIYSRQVTYMHRAVGIRQSGGNQCTFEILLHISYYFLSNHLN